MVHSLTCVALVLATPLTLRSQSVGMGYSSNQAFQLDCTWAASTSCTSSATQPKALALWVKKSTNVNQITASK